MSRRIDVAERLGEGGCGGSDVEAHLILGALISAVAALLWPGAGIDKRRFAETWKRHSTAVPNANLISLPLLIQELDRCGHRRERDALIATKPFALGLYPVPSDLVITGDDVDMSESDVKRICPTLPRSAIASKGYAALYYVHARSGIVHEYKVSTPADNLSFVDKPLVSYTNHLSGPNRRIHFPVRWMTSLVRSIAVSAASDVEEAPLSPPSQWWLGKEFS